MSLPTLVCHLNYIIKVKFALKKLLVKKWLIEYFLLFFVSNFHQCRQCSLIICELFLLEKVAITGFSRLFTVFNILEN